MQECFLSSADTSAGLMHSSDLAELREFRGKTSERKTPVTKSDYTDYTLIIFTSYTYFVHVDSVPGDIKLHFSMYLQSPVLDVIGEHEAHALIWAASTLRDRSSATVSTDLWETRHGGAVGTRATNNRRWEMQPMHNLIRARHL